MPDIGWRVTGVRVRLRDRLILVAALAAVFVASFLLPSTPLMEMTLCPLKLLSGADCPGCGLGRSFVAMSQADPAGAWRANKLGPALYLGAAYALLRNGWAVAASVRHGR